MHSHPLRIAICFLILGLLALAGPAAGAVITIDAGPANIINTTVRNAVAGDTIILNPGTYTETGILVNKNLIIRANTSYGGTAANTIIDGNNAGRIMYVNFGVTLSIDNLTFTRGNCGVGFGGAIANDGTMTISSSTFTSCWSGLYGGAIANSGTMTISSSTFSSCSAPFGGAISSSNAITISSSTFSSCAASGLGGAIINDGTMTISSSTFTSCSATSSGGAIYHDLGVSTVHYSRIYNCNTGTAFVRADGTFSATNTWWGTNSNPAGYTSGGVTSTPWLMLNATASPSWIASSQTSLIRANLTFDSAGTSTIASGHIPNDTVVMFTIISGPGSLSAAGNATTLGAAEITFTPAGVGTTNISATVDGQTVYTLVTVILTPSVAAFTGTPTAGAPPLTVMFNETSTNSPTTWNWSFGDGSVWFNTTIAAQRNATHTYAAAGTYTVSLIASNADGPDTLTRAGYITVAAPPTPVPTTQAPVQVPPASDAGDGSSSDSGPSVSAPSVSLMVNIGGNSAVDHAEVTGSGINNLIVTGMQQSGPGTGIPPLPGPVYQYIGLVPARFTSITAAAITFTVPAAWLEEQGIPTGNIALYHYENGAWVALPTTVVSTANGIVTFTATSPGFSLFAIAGTPGTSETPGVRTIGDLAGDSGPAAEDRAGPQAPVVTQTTAAPAPASQSSPGSLLPVIALAGLIILAAGGFVVRRWWIRRQNPTLFEEYD